jgi:hypothetical protein
MKPIKFDLKEKARKNIVYLAVKFEGGDADTEHWDEYLLKDITFDTVNSNLETIEAEIEKYKILKDLLYDPSSTPTWDEVKEEYGDEIARMFDNVPNDPQGDYQFKCYLDTVIIRAYDKDGNRFEAYLL